MTLADMQSRHMTNNVFGQVNRFARDEDDVEKAVRHFRRISTNKFEDPIEITALVGPEKVVQIASRDRLEDVYIRRITVPLETVCVGDKFAFDDKEYYLRSEHSNVAGAVRVELLRYGLDTMQSPDYLEVAPDPGFSSSVG